MPHPVTTTNYVGMALTYAPPEFRDVFQVELKAALRALPNVTILDFYWVAHSEHGGADTEVYEWDKDHAQKADLFIALVDHPSIGLGMEIMLRHQTGKPTLYFAETGRKVNRMLTGFIATEHNQLHRYETVNDIVAITAAFLKQ